MAKRIDELDAKASVATTDVVPCVTGTSPAEKATALQVAKSHDGDFGAQNVVTTGSLLAGATPRATVGTIRLPSGGTVYGRRQDNVIDIAIIGLNTSNQLLVGDGDQTENIYRTYSGHYFRVGTNDSMAVFSTGPQIGMNPPSAAHGSGSGVLGVSNATTVPSTNPTGGGILYAEGGAGKWRGSSGTITTFGTADPHCPTCGRDFAVEHQNPGLGEHIALCLPCLVDALKAAGVNTAPFTIKDERGATKADWDANHAAARVREAEAEAARDAEEDEGLSEAETGVER
jgi:hypothetical protein